MLFELDIDKHIRYTSNIRDPWIKYTVNKTEDIDLKILELVIWYP